MKKSLNDTLNKGSDRDSLSFSESGIIDDTAILKTITYIEENLYEPQSNWSEYRFSQHSYARWAANEILELLINNPFARPGDLIERFLINVYHLKTQAKKKKDKKVSDIFKVTIKTAEDLLCLVENTNKERLNKDE